MQGSPPGAGTITTLPPLSSLLSQSGPRRPGRVISFYSYKGGTGRSMALANVAWILACSRKRVLVVDWDLEAPGLHRYFRPFLIDKELTASDGLIDLILAYADQAARPLGEGEAPAPDWHLAFADVSDYVLSINFDFPPGGKIDLLPAGRQSPTYAVAVNSFNWQNFYDRQGGGGFLEAVKARMIADYDYVLIDSRTGVSDTSGICTVQLPDTLVVCFTYNNQGIAGASAVARSAMAARRKLWEEQWAAVAQVAETIGLEVSARTSTPPPALPPYRVFPIPMRVEPGEKDRLASRQNYARRAFADLIGHLGPDDQAAYWSQVEVPYQPYYAYEEVLAAFRDNPDDPKDLLAAFVRATAYLTDQSVSAFQLSLAPEDRQKYLVACAETPYTVPEVTESQTVVVQETGHEARIRRLEGMLAGLSESELATIRSVVLRLVHVTRPDGPGSLSRRTVSIEELGEDATDAITLLSLYGVVATYQGSDALQADASGQRVMLADDQLLTGWKTLRRWVDEDREFILWRQQLDSLMDAWERSTRDEGALLSGRLLSEAMTWLARRGKARGRDDLSAAEIDFIMASEARRKQREVQPAGTPGGWREAPAGAARWQARFRWAKWAAGLVAIPLALLVGVWWFGAAPGPPDNPPPPPVATTPPADVAKLLAEGARSSLAGDYGNAERSFAEALKAAPNDARIFAARGVSRSMQGNLNQGITDLTQAIKLDANNADLYYHRAVALENSGDTDKAIEDYGEAIRLRNDYVAAYLNRGQLLAKQGKSEQAVADLWTVIRIAPDIESLRAAQGQVRTLATTDRLRQLLARPTAAGASSSIFTQYNDAKDAAEVASLQFSLGKVLGLKDLPDPVQVSMRTDGEVRYFFPEDAKFAEKVKSTAELALSNQGTVLKLRLSAREAKDIAGARKGRVELWLPSLSRRIPTPAQASIPAAPVQAPAAPAQQQPR